MSLLYYKFPISSNNFSRISRWLFCILWSGIKGSIMSRLVCRQCSFFPMSIPNCQRSTCLMIIVYNVSATSSAELPSAKSFPFYSFTTNRGASSSWVKYIYLVSVNIRPKFSFHFRVRSTWTQRR